MSRLKRRRFVQGVAGLGLMAFSLPALGGCRSRTRREPPVAKQYRIGYLRRVM